MGRKLYLGFFTLLLMALAITVACEDDGGKKWTVTSGPGLTLTSDEIHSKQGRTFVIQGVVTDEVGVDKVNLNIDEWYLDRDIQVMKKDSLVKSYNLYYSFAIPDDATDKEYIVTVTVTNVGGLTMTKQLTVSMNGDFDSPTLSVSEPASGLTVTPSTEVDLAIKCTLSDARQLGYFVVKESSLDLYDSISFMGTGAQTYTYSKTVTLPAVVADYTFNFTLADSAGLVVTNSRTVKASFVYEKMYLADVATDAELVSDLFGVPMLITTSGTNKFVAQYYSEKTNSEVRFLPQTTSFSPHCYGIDPDNNNKLVDSQDALPIVLPEIGYYRITIDVDALTYSVEKYTPTDTPYASNTSTTDDNLYLGELGIIGKGFPGYTDQNWSPKTAIIFDRDASNSYRFTKTLDMEGDVEFIFGPQHQSGWWPEPFWRFDRKVDPEATILKGGDNVDMDVSSRTTYKVVFDSHLNRAKVVKVN
ncbi:MAG: hypothetical protein QM786_05050 [Breznakibacter sp.]